MSTAMHQEHRSQRNATNNEKPAPKALAEMNREELLQEVIGQTTLKAEYVPYLEKEPIKLNAIVVRKLIAKPTKKGFMPSEADITNFIAMCKSRALNPFVGDAFLVGYDSQDGPKFNIIASHQSLLKRAEGHDQYDGIAGGIIVVDSEKNIVYRKGAVRMPGDTLHGAWAKVWRKDRTHPSEVELEIGARKGRSPLWDNDPCGMIVKCAKSGSLREAFPSTLSDMYTMEELEIMQKDGGQEASRSRVSASSLSEAIARTAEKIETPEPAEQHYEATEESYQPSDDEAGGWEPEESEAQA